MEASIEIVENLRSEIVTDDFKTSFFATAQAHYALYIDLLMERHGEDPAAGYDIQAFAVSERARARALIELLAEANTDIRQGVPPNLLADERQLRQAETALRTQRTAAALNKAPESEIETLDREIADNLRAQESLAREIRNASPAYATLEYPEPLTLQEVQTQVLDEDTVLLQYALGEFGSYLFLVTPTSFDTYELPPQTEIDEAARAFAETLRQKSSGTLLPAVRNDSQAIAQLILSPIAERLQTDLKNKRLLVVPDGTLHYIPFAALSLNPDDYQPLILQHEIVTAPSATAIHTLRTTGPERPSDRQTIAVLADPVFSPEDDRVTGEIDSNAADKQRGSIYLEANTERTNTGFPPPRLRGTRVEAEAIRQLVPGDDSEYVALDFDASYATMTDPQLGNYRIVHLATHGYANAENPRFSGLALAAIDQQGNEVEGFLNLNDIFNLNLPADLVVLSACQTGLGNNVRGEGLVGLTRGFMYAGAPRLVVSLWNVDDAGTADLMTQFYRYHLESGLTPARALRQTQIDLLEDPKLKHAYYWAAFSFQGEWR